MGDQNNPNLEGAFQHLLNTTQANSHSIGQLSELLAQVASITGQQQQTAATSQIRSSTSGPKVKEPRTYSGDRSNGQLEDHVRDLTNWIDFYDRRNHWASEIEKVEQSATYLTGRMHRMYTLARANLRTFPEYVDWLQNTFKDNNEQSRLRAEWHANVQGDSTVMDYAADLIYLSARMQPVKSEEEIKDHFRTGLNGRIQIGMAEHPEWDDLPLSEYIAHADRQEQVEAAKDQVRRHTGDRGPERLFAIAGAPRRGGRKASTNRGRPRKDTPEWQEWCRANGACFTCGDKDHPSRNCPKSTKKGGNSPKRFMRRTGAFPSRKPTAKSLKEKV